MTRKPSASLVVAITALVVTLGGTAVAAKFGPFKGDKVIKKHSLSGNRLKGQTITGKQIKLSSLGKVPSASNADAATNATNLGGLPQGAYQGKTRWALVQGNGAVLASSGGVSVDHTPASGVYYLNFGSSLASRPIVATLHEVTGVVNVAPCGGSASPGGINCPTPDDINHLFVSTHDLSGTFADLGFYVVVEAP